MQSYKHSPPGASPKLSQTGPKWGFWKKGKKGLKLSRLGELLNTQKNVHFFAPAGLPGGGAPREAQKCTQNGPILGGY